MSAGNDSVMNAGGLHIKTNCTRKLIAHLIPDARFLVKGMENKKYRRSVNLTVKPLVPRGEKHMNILQE